MLRIAFFPQVNQVDPHIEYTHGGGLEVFGLLWVGLNDSWRTGQNQQRPPPGGGADGWPAPMWCVSKPLAARCSFTRSAKALPIMLSKAMSMS